MTVDMLVIQVTAEINGLPVSKGEYMRLLEQMARARYPKGDAGLACAVIDRAHDDLRGEDNPSARDRQHAEWFLTRRKGWWAEARQFWCDVAGRDADREREDALETLGRKR